MKELEDFRERLWRRSKAIEAARLSLEARLREFVDKHGEFVDRGSADYGAFIGLDEIERLRVALDEYDRVCASRVLTEPDA